MKKLLLFAMGAFLALPSSAQDDVTNFIQNAGFDEDLTWQADGAKKEIVDQSKVLSNRTLAGVATDGSLYGIVNSTTDKKRNDGRTFEATNGFVGMIKGWEWVNLKDDSKPNERIESKACEWVYFGAVPYDLGAEAVPVADDGTTYLSAAPRSDSFEPGDAHLYLRAGWTGAFAYKQVVKLPCAKYRLEYWTININPNNNPNGATATDLTKITCRKDVFTDEEGVSLSAREWTKHEFEFIPTAEFTLQFGISVSNHSSNNTPWVCIDGIKLYRIGEADPMQLLKSDISDLMSKCDEISVKCDIEGFSGLSGEISDYGMEDLEELLEIKDQAELEAAIKVAQGKVALFEQAYNALADINAVMEKIDNLLATTNFGGKAALEDFYTFFTNYKNGEVADMNYVDYTLVAEEKANDAIKAYYLSQEASIEKPADFTIFIQNPWFIQPKAEPTLEDDTYIFPLEYDAETSEPRYTEGSASSADLTSEGWYIAGASGGDQRLNWQRNRSCWNAWASGFTTTLAVAQDITGLPNGFYTVAADLITQSGYANGTQHAYAQTIAGKGVSPALTSEDWDGCAWETLTMTADQKVLVVDGNLTIGAEGTGDGNASAGWFLATNFKLYYLGEAPADAIKNAFDNKVAEAQDLASRLQFKADQKTLNDTIALYSASTDYVAGLKALDAAMKEATKSYNLYEEYIPSDGTTEGKTIPTVAENLKTSEYGAAYDIVKFAYDQTIAWINCDTASYTSFEAQVNLLKNYLNTYTPVYNEAAEVAEKATEKGKAAMQALMNKQKAALTSEMKDKETVDAYVSALNALKATVNKQNIFENPDATDYTAFIQNPMLQAETGWTFNKGNGNNNTGGGQWYDGDGNVRYIDSYNSAGLEGYSAWQLIEDLPNGTYNLGAYTRTPAEGAYIGYALAADTTFVEIPLHYYNTFTDEGADTTVVASDAYGPIWEAAVAAVDAGTATDLDYAIYNANDGKGRGWKHQEMTGIVVTDHTLLIGTMAGTEESKTPKVFGGAWYSVGGWTLTLTAKGNNEGWGGPIESGIHSIVTDKSTMADGIYNLSGVKSRTLQRGVNIIVTNGKVRKVLVK